MSSDLRNSLYLWGGSIAGFALFWVAASQFGALDGASKAWVGALILGLNLFNLGRSIWRLWRRRASSPDN